MLDNYDLDGVTVKECLVVLIDSQPIVLVEEVFLGFTSSQ